MKYGIDVSAFQPAIAWSVLAQDTVLSFCYAKATEGIEYVSPLFAKQHDGAKSIGLATGAYHFFRFSQDPMQQADAFLRVIDGRDGTLVPMVDVEVDDGVRDLQKKIDTLAAFVARVDAAVGKRTLIYTDPGFWNSSMAGTDAFAGHPLWVATFSGTPGDLTLPGGWASWVCHQYTDDMHVPGIPNAVDGDAAPDLTPMLR